MKGKGPTANYYIYTKPVNCFTSWSKNVRYNSTFCEANPNSEEFIEWFCGFIDSEGNFYIESMNNGRSYRFNFQITLHIDDISTLYLIKRKLGIGEIRDRGTKAVFTIRAQKDIVKIINILSKNPLNTKKYLDFFDFKRAFELYTNSKEKTSELIEEISQIKRGMNKSRTSFDMPIEYKYRITPRWLLGFVEGDGSFCIARQNYQLIFAIVQHSRDSELMREIRNFLYKLPMVDTERMKKSSIMVKGSQGSTLTKPFVVSSKDSKSENSVTNLIIVNYYIIKSVIIPFFSSMTWHSKKFLDFEDFTWVFNLREQGHHHTEKGKCLIDSFLDQMNNNRLSTSVGSASKINRELLISQAKIILEGPSNYKKVGGKTWIISENKWLTYRKSVNIEIVDIKDNVIKTCASIVAVMEFLNMSRYMILKRLEDGKYFLWVKENRLIFIREVEF